ncbi:ethanolamine ammonia-lyase subunit EutC [Isosphaeraceae bacterium EP7]
MSPEPTEDLPAEVAPSEAALRARTPARIFVGRAGTSYRTETQLALRLDHAAALDAVRSELSMDDLPHELVERFGIFEVCTRAADKAEYLRRPDLGRSLNDEARAAISRDCPRGAALQVAIGDGLSSEAVRVQVPVLLPLLAEEAGQRGWTMGRVMLIHHCRVGVINDLGDLLAPTVVVLLIGERPGLATAESLSAYLAFRPCAGQTDAHRNLISNIHSRGVTPEQAAPRIAALAARMIERQLGGVEVKEQAEGFEMRMGGAIEG